MDRSMLSKKLKTFLIFLALISISMACNFTPSAKSNVSIISHSSPNINDIDISAFKNIDCTWQSENFAICNEDGIFRKMGCTSISTPNSYLSLLDPPVSLISCNFVPESIEEIDKAVEGIYNTGCSRPVLQRFVVYQEGNYQLIKNLPD